VGVHSSSFRDFMLKPELLRSIVDFGFEHPSEGESFAPLPLASAAWSRTIMGVFRARSGASL
jgi:hypothetical protein